MKKVSVIMSTYKTEQHILNEAINSILNQTYKNIEFIIVCDGDKEEYNRIKQIDNPQIKVLLNETNKGLPYSLNLAIKNATGDYIARMDSDDISLPNRLEIEVDYLEKNSNIDLCSMYVHECGDYNNIKKVFLKSYSEIKCQMLYRAVLVHPVIMGRKEIFKEFKYNEEFKCAQDFELWSRISDKYQIAVIPKVGLNYRIHKKQASIAKRENQKSFAKEIIKRNSYKITGEFDEKIFNTLLILGGIEKLNKDNYLELSKNIDYILSINKNFDSKALKKVLYNRFFELSLKSKIFRLNFLNLKKYLKIYNFMDICFKLK